MNTCDIQEYSTTDSWSMLVQCVIYNRLDIFRVTWVTGVWTLARRATAQGFWATRVVLATSVINSGHHSLAAISSPIVGLTVVNTSTEMAITSPLTVDSICLNKNNNSNFKSFTQLKKSKIVFLAQTLTIIFVHNFQRGFLNDWLKQFRPYHVFLWTKLIVTSKLPEFSAAALLHWTASELTSSLYQ